ncbi:LysR family transcriptional regulator (plasmid) [Acidiphilium multivorum AIU301]|uniref:LysR family transcriptional regulator n=1 Tax=Acidiphilium multivorum (strain DSM 11245 / JCM 8867 / NBRC 100883 / AIU 301) TaxID=926570 RepID=F0J7G4_ACIMA|nr:LysR family transcriptional regulator [Acidiphilium multivorum]BAJ83031.1 LysR family transcriptional regulator [Acidiphilium multivorum AIU301]GAN73471.1 transcriptional regulator LysR [Acidiphilium multivorum AIU301]
MDLTAIEVFLKLATELHFGRTAERLGLPQPRVSRIVRGLENEVGGALFERTSRRVRLTPLGTLLRDSLSQPYADLKTAFNEARDKARGVDGVLRVGALATTTGPVLTRLMEAFARRVPNCRLMLSEVESFDPYRALRAGEVDVLVTWLAIDEPDLVAGPVLDLLPRVVIVAARHPLAKRSSVSIEDIADYGVPWAEAPFPAALMDVLNPQVTPSGKSIQRILPVKSMIEIAQAVASGTVVHITLDSLALFQRPDIVSIPLRDMPLLPLGLVWRQADENQRIRALAKAAAIVGSRN